MNAFLLNFLSSVAGGLIVAACSLFVFRRYESLRDEVKKLKDERVSGLEKRQDKLAQSIQSLDLKVSESIDKLRASIEGIVSLLSEKIEEATRYGTEGRRHIHEKIENKFEQCIRKEDVTERLDNLLKAFSEIKASLESRCEDAVVTARQAQRQCDKLEGKLENTGVK